MAPGEAVELVREGLCHAAAVAGTVGAPPIEDAGARLVGVRLAECDMYLATGDGCAAPATPDDVLRRGIRVAVGPQGTPARRVLDDAVRASGAACEISEMRSDAAAVAAVAQGHADCAVSARPAALRAGLTTLALGRAAFDLVIHRAPGDDDPAVRALLDGLRSPSLALALEADGYDAGGIARRAADGRRPKTDDNSNREDRQ
jgi:molybdate-binding protein